MQILTLNRYFVQCLSFIFLYLPCSQSFSQEPTYPPPPNIILVMVDDLGTEAIGCYGGTSYRTPVLDKMAEEGVRFSHAYAYPLCTPTRVSLMTGKYNFRNWKAFGILDPQEKTLGHFMQEQGYRTCMVGKWQLQSYDPIGYPGAHLRRNTGMKVEDAGFDEYSMWHTGHTEDKGSRFANPVIYENGRFLENTQGKYGPDIFTDYLLDFVDRHSAEPFFVYYPMALTHGPFVPSPNSEAWNDPTKRLKQDTKYFKDMVEYTDEIIGRILNKLEEKNLSEKTLLIFYSDNGTHQKLSSQRNGKTVQGAKGKEIDAGTRVPMIVQWKGKAKAGWISEDMVAPSDFLPTLFAAMGRKMPKGTQTDGESFLESLTGKSEGRRDWVYVDHNSRPGWDKENFAERRFVRGPSYKLYADGSFFEPEVDPLEERPFAPRTKEERAIKDRYMGILDSLRRYRTFGYLESFDPAFDKIVPPHTKIEIIAQGFTWTEGPVWVPQEQTLLWSDVPRNVIYKWSDADGVMPFLKLSGYTGKKERGGGKGSNGMTLDHKGKLLICRQGDREVARLASSFGRPLPVYEALATHWQGKKLNSPNDVVVDKAGNIYFTDPPYGLDRSDPNARELDFHGVYRIATNGNLSLLDDELPRPNGIGISPDEKTLYVANSDPQIIVAYDLAATGEASNKRKFFDVQDLYQKSISKQAPDGMAVNDQGIVFATGPDGVLVLSPEGKHLGTIRTNKRTSNCTLNEDQTVLYVTCHDYVLRVVMGYKLGFD